MAKPKGGLGQDAGRRADCKICIASDQHVRMFAAVYGSAFKTACIVHMPKMGKWISKAHRAFQALGVVI